MLHLLEGPVKGHITEDRKRKKAHHQAGIEPMTSLLRGLHSTAMQHAIGFIHVFEMSRVCGFAFRPILPIPNRQKSFRFLLNILRSQEKN